MDVGAWLRSLGLGQYVEVFQGNAIDEDVLPDLSDQDFASMGVLLGHRKKLLKAIAALTEGATTVDEAAQRSPTRGTASGERRQLTVMFVDLVGSTALSRQLDPEEMGEVIRGYQNSVAGEIARFEGRLQSVHSVNNGVIEVLSLIDFWQNTDPIVVAAHFQ